MTPENHCNLVFWDFSPFIEKMVDQVGFIVIGLLSTQIWAVFGKNSFLKVMWFDFYGLFNNHPLL